MKNVYSFNMADHISQYELVVNGIVDNKEGKTRKVADIRTYHFGSQSQSVAGLCRARTEQPAVAEMPTHSFVQPAIRPKP